MKCRPAPRLQVLHLHSTQRGFLGDLQEEDRPGGSAHFQRWACLGSQARAPARRSSAGCADAERSSPGPLPQGRDAMRGSVSDRTGPSARQMISVLHNRIIANKKSERIRPCVQWTQHSSATRFR